MRYFIYYFCKIDIKTDSSDYYTVSLLLSYKCPGVSIFIYKN
mgnify:CR=1 FL=1